MKNKIKKNIKDEDELQYEWDLDALLQGSTLEELYQEWKLGVDKSIKIYPNFIDSYKNFKNWLDHSQKLRILSNRLSNYISNNYNMDVTNEKWISWSQKLSNYSNKLTVALSDYENRILENEDKIRQYLQNSEISEYQRSFDMIIKTKPHTLSNVEEKLLAKLSKADGGVEEMYDSLITSDIKFEDATNSKGKKIPIKTQSEIFVNLKSSDRMLRKTSWLNFNDAFYKFRVTLTHALYYNYLSLNTDCKVRNFKDYVDSCCFSDEIKRELILHIYDQVKEYKTLHKQYVEHRKILLKQLLKLSKLEPWDQSVDLINKKTKFSREKAKKIVIAALKPLGDEYVSVIQKAFNERWISWMPKPNKYTGAYSISGTKGLNKFYILMNYDYTLGSVSTLIHELGHSLNSYFYSKHQKVYSSVSIFTAEIASITNEMLLNYYLLDNYKNNKDLIIMILDQMIGDFFATTSRQIIFSEFEYNLSDLINNDKPITYDVIKDLYLELQKKYIYIKDVKKLTTEPYVKSLITPLRISHFFVGNFYVYKYAIGQIVACIVASRIYHGDNDMKERYMKFLSSGTSLSPIETIKLLNIDLYSSDPWIEASKIINGFIKRFKTIKKI